ncbi:phage holin family protein [Naasia lichenicola]|uniref:Phage holin family protein n=1 Tax=Naasia lichenicola TaxID=2565933 RepID=A0A4V3WSU9_9MICO|nr:phage holin family protein [Naasia lichenicola]THG29487.1 phage holin family protein [Naasia lichenicola]
MRRLLVALVGNGVALWLTTLLIGPVGGGVTVSAYAPGGVVETLLTYALLAIIFGVVNGLIGTAIRIVAFPLYLLTLGLIALVVNGLLFLLVAWISGGIGFGLSVEGFWWGVLGAFVMGIFNWIIGLILRPLAGTRR